MVEVEVVPADGCAGIGPLSQVMAGLTGRALVTAASGAALAGRVALLATPAVTPESPGTLGYTQSIGHGPKHIEDKRWNHRNEWEWVHIYNS